ncbi:glycoside hydrolase family 16 protein [Pseudonocardia hydrocarbonoxydans]|uniref:GH16 domain-containing protein n=1 Tax=Pseudonocardia hydrocarbonoxydans TaxID=76726 RepID=A0A4Y3WKS7_9PSEU|nr:glycoside hydrolase family 16 protein [Pseudonocardia hydrocarbonoxydans]GEC19118.1 hypothetical protein PHY01_14010 [Pseudonocardia hydrocarbonoxydans]
MLSATAGVTALVAVLGIGLASATFDPAPRSSPGVSVCPTREQSVPNTDEPVEVDRSDPAVPIWSDEFDSPMGTPIDPARWWIETGGLGWGEEELQAYTDSRANVGYSGTGDLVITARREPGEGGARYTSARVSTCGTFEFTSGRVEARMRLPEGQGLWPAFWLLGARQPWPQYGEIDIMESINDMSVVEFNTHQPLPDGTDWEKSSASPVHPSGSWANDYHVFAVDWRADSLEWSVDGTVYARTTRSDTPAGGAWVIDESPQIIVLNLAVGGYPGAPDATTPFPAELRIDWVRVYANADTDVTRQLT